VEAALSALPPDHPGIEATYFFWGDYCPRGCPASTPFEGWVVFDMPDRDPDLGVRVWADRSSDEVMTGQVEDFPGGEISELTDS
jgi:hypothetical protein